MQRDLTRCYLCGNGYGKLDRHEPWNAANRGKSKEMGLWVVLCHWTCHPKIHANPELANILRREAQQRAMDYYGMTTEEWIEKFGKSIL